MVMRKINNPEITAPAHRIGETEDGRQIYQRVDGWELDMEGETDCVDYDSDGNYVV